MAFKILPNLTSAELSSYVLLRIPTLYGDILLIDGNTTWVAYTHKGIYWKIPA